MITTCPDINTVLKNLIDHFVVERNPPGYSKQDRACSYIDGCAVPVGLGASKEQRKQMQTRLGKCPLDNGLISHIEPGHVSIKRILENIMGYYIPEYTYNILMMCQHFHDNILGKVADSVNDLSWDPDEHVEIRYAIGNFKYAINGVSVFHNKGFHIHS